MMRRLLPILAALVLVSCTGAGSAPTTRTTPEPGPTNAAGPEARGSAGGRPVSVPGAMELTVRTSSGETLDLADFRGQPVLIALLGSYDAMSQASLESIERVARNHGDVLVIGILVQQGADLLVDAYAAGANVRFPIAYEPAGTLVAGTSELGPIASIPFFLSLDVEGRIAAVADGYASDRRLEDLLARAFAAAPVRPREPLPLLGRPR